MEPNIKDLYRCILIEGNQPKMLDGNIICGPFNREDIYFRYEVNRIDGFIEYSKYMSDFVVKDLYCAILMWSGLVKTEDGFIFVQYPFVTYKYKINKDEGSIDYIGIEYKR